MKTNLEIEYKTLITKTESLRLLNHFDFDPFIEQTNVYFDTVDATLFNNKMMCRIRVINNTFEFTLKIPQEDGVLEHEILLDSLSLDNLAVKQLFDGLKIDVLSLIETTRSHTKRYVYRDTFGDWCLDDTTFPHHHDYEIEYELHEANKKAYPHYLDTLAALNIKLQKTEPKYIRALHSSK